ncbi:MAG: CDGSH iron-sulfur domain-containing protein [Actinomycetaceae bacterium]|nr:CDGSH iron-sulfur domain-containing protein [Actinomycetaceae bacterium]MDY5854296.1 CDGSH iron-sulfur domain-containing protein [Arcanobacterium sp.]
MDTHTTPQMNIEIIPSGPIIVRGGVPLHEGRIRPAGKGYVLEEGRELPQAQKYALCRCGHSQDKPFCDGSHATTTFDGLDVAKHNTYDERADVQEGPALTLGDDHRCSFVRFCHNEGGDAWNQAKKAQTSEEIASATQTIDECLAGRLTRRAEDGTWEEPELAPRVTIVQDPQQNASSGIAVQGGIPLKGTAAPYETRQRYMLCRCGRSRTMPFCDASHISISFNDGHIDE